MIARVFPRRTSATPTDSLAFVGGPGLFPPVVERAHVSVSFTWDIPVAERLASEWDKVVPTDIGGPAFGEPGSDFEPGMYLRHGMTITSRGCPKRCWFCSVWKREGNIRELPIRDGWIIQDDNLLACSEPHIRAVFDMLKRQPRRPEFPGGLEAEFLKPWHVDLLAEVRPSQMFFAYDTPDDWEPLVAAGKMLREAGFTRHQMRCYLLIGYPKDTLEAAESRLCDTLKLGFFPSAMLWKRNNGEVVSPAWRKLQRSWMRPASIAAMEKRICL